MKRSVLLLACTSLMLVSCSQINQPAGAQKGGVRPDNIPEQARFIFDLWVLDLESDDRGVFARWDKNGQLLALKYVNNNLLFSAGFSPSGSLVGIHQECHATKVKTKHLQDGDQFFKTPDESMARVYGRLYQFDEEGKLIREACTNPVHDQGDSQETLDEEALIELEEGRLCGPEFFFAPDGSIRERRDHPPCKQACGRFIPSLKVGQYRVWKQAQARNSPSLKGGLLFIAYPGEEVDVVEDTGLLQTIDSFTAPWVKIRTRNGKEGFLFGGLLNLPYYPIDDRELLRLLDHKFLDGELKCP